MGFTEQLKVSKRSGIGYALSEWPEADRDRLLEALRDLTFSAPDIVKAADSMPSSFSVDSVNKWRRQNGVR